MPNGSIVARRSRILEWWPLIAAVLVMIPRLASPQLGLLDDAVTVCQSRGILAGEFTKVLQADAAQGRLRPTYWLYGALNYWLSWLAPFPAFLANLFLLLWIVGCLAMILRSAGRVWWEAGLAAVLLLGSVPTIETFYTLSKSEGLQVAGFLTCILLTVASARSQGVLAPRCYLAGAYLLAAASIFVKETSAAFFGVGLGWWLVGRYWPGAETGAVWARCRKRIFICGIVVSALLLGCYIEVIGRPFSGAGYGRGYELSLSRLTKSSLSSVMLLTHDLPYLFAGLLLAFWLLVRGKQFITRWHADVLIWMLCWLVVLVPWQAPLSYHLFPFAVGAAVFTATVLKDFLTWASERSPGLRSLAIACIGITSAVASVNAVTAAKCQLAVDHANEELLDYLERLPGGARVLVNLPEGNEYVFEIGLHLSQLRGRADLAVGHLKLPVSAVFAGRKPIYIVTPYMKHQLVPSVRVAVHESGARQWSETLRAAFGSRALLERSVRAQFQSFDVAPHWTLCPVFGRIAGPYCVPIRPPVDGRLHRYGWDVYRVSESHP